jgi:hypothetical protein
MVQQSIQSLRRGARHDSDKIDLENNSMFTLTTELETSSFLGIFLQNLKQFSH